ncbi:hypothetical protein WJX79_010921 [Trebouxia sp. C0005]
MTLPKAGELVQFDFRREAKTHTSNEGVKLLQWNIERGYKLEKIVDELKAIDADIIALQEVDVGCERSSSSDTGRHIAEQLALNYVFFCEFEEMYSPLRSPELQGGGVHGNALLSKFDISDARLVHHRLHPVDWNNPDHPLQQSEPRRGQRAVLAATVHTPKGRMLCYCLHMELFCGMLARIEQFADVMRDSKLQIKKGLYHQAIFGDLNTMAHGIARSSPAKATQAVENQPAIQTAPAKRSSQEDPHGAGSCEQDAAEQEVAVGHFPPGLLGSPTNGPLQKWGLPPQVCQDITNPGFVDPFDPSSTVTLDHPAYRYFGFHLMKGKLDWLLLRKMKVLEKSIGNHDYAASDHKWLSAYVQLC